MRKIALLLAAIAAFSTPARAETNLKLYGAQLDYDPNGNVWHVASKVCNKDQVPSGSMLYELRLYQGDVTPGAQHLTIGGFKYSNPLQAGKCRDSKDVSVKVRTKTVAPGEYKVVLWVGDYDGSRFIGHIYYTFDHTFIRSNGP